MPRTLKRSAVTTKKPRHHNNKLSNITTVKLPQELGSVEELRMELDYMVDVLNGHDDSHGLELGELTLLELATAFYGRAMEIKMVLQRGEVTGEVLKNSAVAKFRTRELSAFEELCKEKIRLGRYRVSWASNDMEPDLADVLFGEDEDEDE